jgi:hypothetical protein
MAGRGASPEVRQKAAERRRQVMQLRLRGLTFEAIGKELGISRHLAYKHYGRALRLIPAASVDQLRKLQSERITDAYRRIYMELAGRPHPKFPNDPTKTIRPSVRNVFRLIDTLLKFCRHEALLYGLYAPSRAQAVSAPVGQPVSDEELDRQLARLSHAEQDEFMRLRRKMEGRGVDLGPEYGYEVEARAAAAAALRAANPEKARELELRIIESKPGQERWEQSEVFSYLTSDEHRQLTSLIEKARTRKDAQMRSMGGERPREVQTPHAASNGQGHIRSPVAAAPASPSDILEFEPCPKCGRYATSDEKPIWVNNIPVWHNNCRGLPGATL